MALKDKLKEDMKTALKDRAQGKLRLSVIRLTLSEINNREIDSRKSLSDDEVVEVLSKEVKKRRDVIPDYERAGRPEKVEELNREIEILTAYLPQQLSENEIETIVKEAIASTGCSGKSDIGKVMAQVMPKVKGKADGRTVNQIAARLLE